MNDGRPTLADRLRHIDVLVLDVDGVLTNGGIVYDNAGMETKHFHVRDGSGLKIWHYLGKRTAIITGRKSDLVARRAEELGISLVFQGAMEKIPAYRQVLSSFGVSPNRVCSIGDDVPDLGVLANCGLAVAVADACSDVRRLAHMVTQSAGGRGAVREVIEMILNVQQQWQPVVGRFRDETL